MKLIRDYLEQVQTPDIVKQMKLADYEKHKDIAEEFEYWIKTHKYMQDNCVEVEGYTAEKLSRLSEFLEGEGAFGLLIELRENPKRAMKKISEGIKIK